MNDETKKEIAREVTAQVLQSIKEEVIPAVEGSINKHVNGKIDRLHKIVEEHMEEVEPFLEGWKGGKRIGNVIKWFAGFIIAVGAAVATIYAAITFFK